jgi:hypothetical protein
LLRNPTTGSGSCCDHAARRYSRAAEKCDELAPPHAVLPRSLRTAQIIAHRSVAVWGRRALSWTPTVVGSPVIIEAQAVVGLHVIVGADLTAISVYLQLGLEGICQASQASVAVRPEPLIERVRAGTGIKSLAYFDPAIQQGVAETPHSRRAHPLSDPGRLNLDRRPVWAASAGLRVSAGRWS